MTLLHQLWSRVVCCWDFNTLTPDGLLRDFGPHELHATFPGAGANPTRLTDGSYGFNGAQYLTLAGTTQARFYSVAPIGATTWLVISRQLSPTTGSIFGCDNNGGGGVWKGIHLYQLNQVSFLALQLQGGAGVPYVSAATPTPLPTKQVAGVTVETTPRSFVNAATTTAAWAAGAFGTAVYDPAVVPNIGRRPAGVEYYNGYLSYLAVINTAIPSSDLLALIQMMRDGQKPWTARAM